MFTYQPSLLSVIMASLLSLSAVQASDDTGINDTELFAYAAQKYRVDYRVQTDKSKNDIRNEYLRNIKLADALLKGPMKEDTNLKVATRLITVEIWAQKFMQETVVSDDELKSLYVKSGLKTPPSYRFLNILVPTGDKADKLIASITNIKDKAKQLEKFKQLVQSDSEDPISRKNGGESGWVDSNKLDPNIQNALKDKKAGEIVKADITDVGTQILLIDDYKPEKAATFDEAKATLLLIAKQEKLNAEVNKILTIK